MWIDLEYPALRGEFWVQLTSFRVTLVWICELLQVDSKTGDPVGEEDGRGEGEEKVPNFSTKAIKKTVFLCAESVLGEKSSKVTKVPLAELRRLFVTESKSLEYMERKDRKKKVKCRER